MAKPLSADEIVKANAKKRAAGSLAAGPAKIGRLDAAAMAALGKRSLNKSHSQGQNPGQGLGQGTLRPSAPEPGQPVHPQGGSVRPQAQAGLPQRQAPSPQGLLGNLQGQVQHPQGQGQGSGHIPIRSLPQQQGQNSGQMSVSHPHAFGQGIGQAPAVGQGGFRSLPGMPQQGGPGLIPHPNPASPLLAVLSPLGTASLLGPASGLDNLFNEEVLTTAHLCYLRIPQLVCSSSIAAVVLLATPRVLYAAPEMKSPHLACHRTQVLVQAAWPVHGTMFAVLSTLTFPCCSFSKLCLRILVHMF